MEVKDPNVALLSNYEVFKLLSDVRAETKRDQKRVRPSDGLSTIVYETLKFLETTPAVVQSPEVLKEFCRSVAPFRLTKAEKLQILNLRPTAPVEIQLIVEECEERLSEEKVNELTDIVSRLLPLKSDITTTAPADDMERNE